MKNLKYASVALLLTFGGCSEPDFDEKLESGEKLIVAGDADSAIIELKNAVRINPNSATARFLLGKAYFNAHNYESSEKELRKSLELGFSSTDVIPLLVTSLVRTESFNAVIKLDIEQSDFTNEELVKLYFYKIQSFSELGQFPNALMFISEIEKIETASSYKVLSQAYKHIFQAEYQSALDVIHSVRPQMKSEEDYLRLELRLLLGLENFRDAKSTFRELLIIRPDDNQTKFSYLSVLMDTQDYVLAEPLINELMLTYQNNPILHQMLGVVNVGKANFEDALPNLEFSIKFGIDTDVTRLMAGYAAYRLNDFETTVKHLDLIEGSLYPGHPALRVLVDSWLKLGRVEQAARTLRKIDGKRAGDHTLFIDVSEKFFQMGDKKSSLEFASRSEDLISSDSEKLQTGIMELSLSDISGLSKIEEVASKLPASTKLNNALGATYIESGNIDKAISLAKRWRISSPTSPYPNILAMRAYLKNENLELARQELEKAAQLDAQNEDVLMAKVEFELHQGNKEKAKELLDEFVTLNPRSSAGYKVWFSITEETETKKAVLKKVLAQIEKAESTALRLTAAEMFHSLNDFDKAVTLLNQVEPELGLNDSFWKIKGNSLIRMGHLEPAQEHYALWIKMMPRNSEALLGHLLVLNKMGDVVKALSLATEYTKRSNDERLLVMKAFLHSSIGQVRQASDDLSKLSIEHAKTQFAVEVRSRVDEQLKQRDDDPTYARQRYHENNSIPNLIKLVSTLESRNKLEESILLIQAHIEKRPEDIVAKSLLAERLAKSQPKRAKTIYNEILAAEPSNFHALNNLALLHIDSGDISEARKLAEKAVDTKPNSADALDTLAQTYISGKDYEEAVKLFESLPKDTLFSDELYFNFVKAVTLSGDKLRAKQMLKNHRWKDTEQKKRLEVLIGA